MSESTLLPSIEDATENDPEVIIADTERKLRVIAAAKRFLYHRGYIIKKIINNNPVFDIIAVEDDPEDDSNPYLVFVRVFGQLRGYYFAEPEIDRAEFEKEAISYLKEQGDKYVGYNVRFDAISIIVLSEDRAFIRHHINALSCGDDLITNESED